MTEQNFSTVRLVAAILLAMGTTQAVGAQDAVTCPVQAVEGMQADEIRQLLPTGDAFKDAGALAAAVTRLQSGGQAPGTIINALIAAYCPTVNADTRTTQAEKTEEIRQFAARVTQLVGDSSAAGSARGSSSP